MAKDQAPGTALLVLVAAAGLLTAAYSNKPARLRRVGGPDDDVSDRPGNEVARPRNEVKGGVEVTQAGADAEAPHQIPAKGWWAVVKRSVAGFSEDRLMTEAAGVTFYTLLAIFPAIASMISIYGLVADPASVNDQLVGLRGVVPSGGLDIISEQVKALTAKGSTALGFGVLFGLGTSLWSSNAGMKALFDALNVVYHEKEKRSFIRFTGLCMMFTLGAILFIIVSIISIAVVPLVLKFFGLENEAAGLIAVARWPALVLVLVGLLSLIYRYGPSRDHARWQWVTWGGAFAALTWLGASLGFSYYVTNFGSYDKTYGSLGAVVGFMTWIWISTIIVLLGAELNAELEQQTYRDSTVGPPKPMGQRGAFKADNKA